MDNLKVALTIARKNYAMASIDLCDEYHVILTIFRTKTPNFSD